MGFGDQLTAVVDNLKNDFLNQLNSKQKSTVDKVATNLPWQSSISKFYPIISIDTARWDQLYPYRLIVIDVSQGNKIVNGNTQTSLNSSQTSNGSAVIDFVTLNNQWVFQLPITPEQLSISEQFAINTTATLRGILEEHNGSKFKIVNASGTFGVWPYRESVTKPPTSPSVVQSLFGGTIEAIGSTLSSIAKVINTATSNSSAPKPTTIRPESSASGPTSTGYYNALAMQQFLEQYAEAKRNPANAGWRLVFDIPKQKQSYVVTPMQYTWIQNVQKPMQINYTMQLKAWRRVFLDSPKPISPQIDPISPGILQRIMNTISAARTACSAATNLIGAVRSDVETPLNVLRQTALFVKDLAGVATTAADLPSQLIKDYKSQIATLLSGSGFQLNNTNPSVRSGVQSLKASAALNEGLSQSAVAGGQLGTAASHAQSIDPSYNIFANPSANFAILDAAPLSSLKLNQHQLNQVANEINAATSLTVDDLKTFRAQILELATQLSNNFGAGDATYSQVYGTPAPVTRLTPMTVDDYEILKTLYDAVQSYDILTATTQIDDNQTPSSMEYVAGLATASGIPFVTSTSKTLAPVPFGLTIEQISARYLNDPQRWIEIATLNNLRDPYIDEDGFQYSLLSNATGRQIVVASDINLYLGQPVVLKSSTQFAVGRSILGIDKLSETSFLITLDGNPDLDNFLLTDKAYLQAYLPGTVNSQQKIFIPSDLPIPNDPSIIMPAIATSDPLSGLSKVDWLLTDSGDIAVNNFGDFRLSYGITNIVQALRIKVGTPRGKVLLHPEFGMGVKPGTINADINVQELYDSLNKMIQNDSRFSELTKLQIALDGPTLTVNMGVQLAGVQGVFPISFKLTS